jgi:signal transduction histidine kinase
LFVNLFLNSFQAIEGAGKIHVSIKAQAPHLLTVIYEDNGPGIPEEQLSRVFDPFYTTKQVGEGTGLGLFIVANIIEEHSGDISIEASATGGVRFIINLPRNPAEQSMQTPPQPEMDS